MPLKAAVQWAYRIEVAEDPNFQQTVFGLWKSDSDQSVHVELKGFQTASCKRYYYRIGLEPAGAKFWRSDQAFFETGFMDSTEWKAEWISAPKALGVGANQVPMFRRDFLSMEK